MRSSAAFALISLNVAGWATLAAAEDSTQGATEKHGKIVATAPRHVDTTHGPSTAADHSGAAVIANLGGASAGAAASLTGVVPASGGNATIGMMAHAERYKGFAPTGVVTGIDRTGAVGSFGGVQTASVRPMGTGAATAGLVGVSAPHDAITRQSGTVAVGGVLSAAAAVAGWKAGFLQGIESTSVRAAVLADAPGGGGLTQKLGGTTPRAVGIWNSTTSMESPAQRIKPVRQKR